MVQYLLLYFFVILNDTFGQTTSEMPGGKHFLLIGASTKDIMIIYNKSIESLFKKNLMKISCKEKTFCFHLILSLLLISSFLILPGCSTLPKLKKHTSSIGKNGIPVVIDANGLLSGQQSLAIINKMALDNKEKQDLIRLMVLEEAISGQPLIFGNKVTLLKDGPETYLSMMRAINESAYHVNMEFYIFEDDKTGKKFCALLEKKLKDGVDVNIIYDSLGCILASEALFPALQEQGANTLAFRQLNPIHLIFFWLLNRRDHRKIMIVDNDVAFTGGINISEVYSGNPVRRKDGYEEGESEFWRDTNVMIKGPAVRAFQNLFFDTWRTQGGPSIGEKNYFSKPENCGEQLIRVVSSSPYKNKGAIYLAYLSAIKSARKYIHISMAYFAPGKQFKKALGDAAKRGVDVSLIVPGLSTSTLTVHAGRSYYNYLLKRGVKIYEREGSFLHSKTAVIDGVWSTVGTANLTYRSFLNNEEVNTVIYGKGFAKELDLLFREDLEVSKQITIKGRSKRPFSIRFMELLGGLVKYFL